ncbi:hypothetical protein [Saccharothrix sp. HUAS TT1]|uniref:hypothetical protein n=1 Tax=unclassified Saccharothrix TaxID=2593673 RepID=UPI00345BD9E5
MTVTVDADGALVDATFADGIVRTTPDELSGQLLIALSRAEAQITGRVREVAGETVGEDGADRIAGYYAQKFAGLGEPDQGAVRPDQRWRRHRQPQRQSFQGRRRRRQPVRPVSPDPARLRRTGQRDHDMTRITRPAPHARRVFRRLWASAAPTPALGTAVRFALCGAR